MNKRERAEKLRQAQLERDKRDLQWVMGSEEGRRVMYRLLEQAGIYTTSFVAGDPHATSFREGMRNNGLQLMQQLLNAGPAQYNQMLQEAHLREQHQADYENNNIEEPSDD